jgi:hypothetical protein
MQGSTGDLPILLCADTPGPVWSGEVYGTKLFALDGTGQPLEVTGEPTWPAAAVWEFTTTLAGPPVVMEDLGGPSSPTSGILVGLVDGSLWAFDDEFAPNGALQPLWGPVSLGDSLACAPSPGENGSALCCVAPATLILIHGDGTAGGEPLFLTDAEDEPVAGILAPPRRLPPGNTAAARWAVFATDGWFLVTQRADSLSAAPSYHTYPEDLGHSLHTAVVPRDDFSTLLLFGDGGSSCAWQVNLANAVTGLSWPGEVPDSLVCEPAVADLNGDGANDLILLSPQRVLALQADGQPLAGFPLPLRELHPLPDTTRIAGPVVVCDATGDGQNELFFATDQGHLFYLDARGRLGSRVPYLWGPGGSVTLSVGPSAAADERILWLLSAGGHTAPPWDRRWQNGRVVGYRLPGSGTAATVSTEWLGPAGGSERRGPSGTATVLDGDAAWQAETRSVVIYPNPLTGAQMTIRFYSQTNRTARLVVYNLEGEVVERVDIPTTGGQVKEYPLSLPDLASGLYVCQLERETADGIQHEIVNLAVAK